MSNKYIFLVFAVVATILFGCLKISPKLPGDIPAIPKGSISDLQEGLEGALTPPDMSEGEEDTSPSIKDMAERDLKASQGDMGWFKLGVMLGIILIAVGCKFPIFLPIGGGMWGMSIVTPLLMILMRYVTSVSLRILMVAVPIIIIIVAAAVIWYLCTHIKAWKAKFGVVTKVVQITKRKGWDGIDAEGNKERGKELAIAMIKASGVDIEKDVDAVKESMLIKR